MWPAAHDSQTTNLIASRNASTPAMARREAGDRPAPTAAAPAAAAGPIPTPTPTPTPTPAVVPAPSLVLVLLLLLLPPPPRGATRMRGRLLAPDAAGAGGGMVVVGGRIGLDRLDLMVVVLGL
jgi:hypothetical protein